jgi:hypothetical protein
MAIVDSDSISLTFQLREHTQVDDSGHRILQENTGNRWNMEAVFRPGIVWIFSGGFLCFPAGTGQKSSEKFPAGILLPQNHRNYPEPAVSGSGCSTWVAKCE